MLIDIDNNLFWIDGGWVLRKKYHYRFRISEIKNKKIQVADEFDASREKDLRKELFKYFFLYKKAVEKYNKLMSLQ